jgi:hypothetical protein
MTAAPFRCPACGRLVDCLPPSRGCSPRCRAELAGRKHDREMAEVKARLDYAAGAFRGLGGGP